MKSLPRFAFLAGLVAFDAAAPLLAQIDTVQTIAPGVFFHQGDIRRGHSNNGWIVFEDYVLVIEANFPSGAKVVMPKIKETSAKPVRFAFNTHHQGDHAYGSQTNPSPFVWATPSHFSSTRRLPSSNDISRGNTSDGGFSFDSATSGRFFAAPSHRPGAPP